MSAMRQLGNGLSDGNHYTDAASVKEAELSMLRRLGASEGDTLGVQGNLANTYSLLSRHEEALQMKRDVYSGWSRLNGEEDEDTLRAVLNYADSLISLKRFKEAKSVLRKSMPVARRVLGEDHDITLKMRLIYAKALYTDAGATHDNLRAAVLTLEETERTARRVFGGPHPITVEIESSLRASRVVLSAREGDVEPLRAAVEAMAPGDA